MSRDEFQIVYGKVAVRIDDSVPFVVVDITQGEQLEKT